MNSIARKDLTEEYERLKQAHEKFLQSLDCEVIRNVSKFSRDVAVHNGIVFNSTSGQYNVHHIPYSLFPCFLPKRLYDDAVGVQTLFNKLMYLVSQDTDFLGKELRTIAQEDGFTRRLLEIMNKAELCPFRSNIHATVFRSDYMVDQRSSGGMAGGPGCEISLKQVEINTVSCSFAGHASQMPQVHQAVIQKLQSYHLGSHGESEQGSALFKEYLGQMKIPDNQNLVKEVAELIHNSAVQYRRTHRLSQASLPRCSIFVVQPNERNSYDQLKVKMELASLHQPGGDAQSRDHTYVDVKPSYPVFFCSLSELYYSSSTSTKDGSLVYRPVETRVNSMYEVEVVYFRAGYHPNDYPTENEWSAREFIECSRAVKVPNVSMQLAGCKKIQQSISVPSKLSRFLPEPADQVKVSKFFTGLYSLDPSEVNLTDLEVLYERVKASPGMFVMKPQREGGGFNLYGEDIVKKMDEMLARRRLQQQKTHVVIDTVVSQSSSESSLSEFKSHSEYILMDMIRSPPFKNLFIHQSSLFPELEDSINELGIWGFHIHSDGKDVVNKSGGYLMRTKRIQELDGGVASGRAALGSVFWV